MDLVASFAYEVELALARGLKVTILTMDVQGVFDALLVKRLLKRIIEQGWPRSLLQLVRSFLIDRRVRIRFEDSTTRVYKVACGILQGSLLSPILYILYLAELLNKDKTFRFGYADDLCFFRVSYLLEHNVELLAIDAKEVLDYGFTNKFFFDRKKYEMIYFARARTATNPDLVIPRHYTVSFIVTSEKKSRYPALRWLGVYFDKKLRYKRHVEERNEKAFHVARHIRSLAKMKDGPPVLLLRKMVITYIVSSLFYRMEVWYAGRTRIAGFRRNDSPKIVSTRLGGYLRLLESILVTAIKGLLPVWRTTPLATLFRDSGLPSPQAAGQTQPRVSLRSRLQKLLSNGGRTYLHQISLFSRMALSGTSLELGVWGMVLLYTRILRNYLTDIALSMRYHMTLMQKLLVLGKACIGLCVDTASLITASGCA